ncbi:nucleoside 2-deoxyribosyltransferase [Methanosarcina sp. 2.H.T.1A.6]|uniref:nucleoside 2-deoxyribosyltransferase n=1 Tax=unclassified Methanosarcina TaxID=2644672 RepID=UPI00062214C6|nr:MULTISPECIES: nucleoside 2-deoxyribosyltransferase [unclassified Methanosarcina]KKG11760.1 nucleoside 2-deoxyribosyltransferase [Methanosarcina sp. 2.H.T.1A.15]KKG17654.1 nucleoside 2-deoxyribosyltransferase [Methanosarcina sp. 2.H.T.1A.3]KKG21894.1 nucleoside 2-deoxyribosyltransferase [Methanosarcina sp. 2.H.T.1A.6]KKG25430.1 nucleoside 2-deoxyribosyltransferase [Methanosarcina sp. 2.H.T.1A.8]
MSKKKRIYLAGPLFTHAELEYNLKLKDMLLNNGFSVFLPQEDAEDAAHERERQNQECIFTKCVEGVDASDLVVAVLDGVDVDSGTAWEIGYAYAKGKPVIGLRTDFRAFSDGIVNLMVEMAIVSLAKDEEELLKVTEKFR